jgi:hypothetical protein
MGLIKNERTAAILPWVSNYGGLLILPGVVWATQFDRSKLIAAPVGYVAGFVLGFCPVWVGIFGLSFALIVSLSFASLGVFFASLLLGLLVLGSLFDMDPRGEGVCVAIIVVPLLISFASRRALVLPVRRRLVGEAEC